MKNWLKEDRAVYAWVPAFIWGGIVFFFSVLPYKGVSPLVSPFDKMLHFFEYTLLAFLIIRGYFKITELGYGKSVLFTLIIGGGYGILLELIQQYVPGRDANVWDAAANIAGVAFGILIGKVIIWQK